MRIAVAGAGEKRPLEMKEPLKGGCRHFNDCISRGLRPRTDREEALNVLRALQACQESLEQGGTAVFIRGPSADFGSPEIFTHETAIMDPDCDIGKGDKVRNSVSVSQGAVKG